MTLPSAIADLAQEVKRVPSLVTAQIAKWNGHVQEEIAELETFKNNFESAGIGLKKYKGVIGLRPNYHRAVIPLVDLTDGNGSRISAFSYTEGRFSMVRMNGCCIQSSVIIDIKAIKMYSSENMHLQKINLDTEHVKPCKFLYNGRLWGGLEVYFNVQSHHLIFNGFSNCNELGYIAYEDVRGTDGDGKGVVNAEIKNSLEILEA